MNAEHIQITTSGWTLHEAIAKVLALAGDPETQPSDGNSRMLWFGFGGTAVGIGPNPWFPDEEHADLFMSFDTRFGQEDKAKGDAEQMYRLLAAGTDWGLELTFHDSDEPARTRPPRTAIGVAAG